MESLACQEVVLCPAEAPVVERPRRLAVAFQFDNLRVREKPQRLGGRPAISVPAYSRIEYRAGAVRVR